jgi:ABC-type transport system involved in multi-copper enzyme maturation permease subunit
MKTLFALTKNTFRETVRDRILLVIAFFGVVLIVATQLLSAISVRQDEKVLLDLGLGLIDMFGMIITIFVGTQLIFREIDKRTIFIILSKPVTRSAFLLSKFFGLGGILLLVTSIMLLVFIVVVGVQTDIIFQGGAFQYTFLGKLLLIAFFSFLSFLLLLSIVVFFSSFMAPILATFSSLILFVVGHITDDIRIFASHNADSGLQIFSDVIYFGLPNFSILNLKNFVLNTIPLTNMELVCASGGALLWMGLLLFLGTFFFSRREF